MNYLPDRTPTGNASAILVNAEGKILLDDGRRVDAPIGQVYPTREEAVQAARRIWRCAP